MIINLLLILTEILWHLFFLNPTDKLPQCAVEMIFNCVVSSIELKSETQIFKLLSKN